MKTYILLDELHIQAKVPRDPEAVNLAALRRYLIGRPFRQALARAVRSLFAGRAGMAAVRVRMVR